MAMGPIFCGKSQIKQGEHEFIELKLKATHCSKTNHFMVYSVLFYSIPK